MVSVGSLNLPEALLSAELKLMILERLVEQLLEDQAKTGRKLNIDIEAIKKDSLKQLKEKYPDLRIKAEDDA